jgi:hypothetical protein
MPGTSWVVHTIAQLVTIFGGAFLLAKLLDWLSDRSTRIEHPAVIEQYARMRARKHAAMRELRRVAEEQRRP